MRELSLFSGAGGGLLGTKLLGWTHVGYVEWDDYCQRVIAARIADGYLDAAPIFCDIRAFVSEGYAAAYSGLVDCITGGFPCQDISTAGTGAGISGERSGLWKTMLDCIRIIRPRFAILENSPALTVRGLGVVLGDLAEVGMDAKWGVLGARHAGGNCARDRIWIVARAKSYRPAGCEVSARVNSQSHFTRPRARPTATLFPELGGRPFIPIPDCFRVDDGLAPRMDRLKAVGNGQVPAVVALAWRLLA